MRKLLTAVFGLVIGAAALLVGASAASAQTSDDCSAKRQDVVDARNALDQTKAAVNARAAELGADVGGYLPLLDGGVSLIEEAHATATFTASPIEGMTDGDWTLVRRAETEADALADAERAAATSCDGSNPADNDDFDQVGDVPVGGIATGA